MPIHLIQISVFKAIHSDGRLQDMNFVFGAELGSSMCPGRVSSQVGRHTVEAPALLAPRQLAGQMASGSHVADGHCGGPGYSAWSPHGVAGVVHVLEVWACPPNLLPSPQTLAGNEDAVCMGSKLLETQTR